VLFVGVTQVFINRRVFLCNAVLVTATLLGLYRYSTINNPAKK